MALINQVAPILNEASSQVWGEKAISVIDLQSFIALGDFILNSASAESKDVWTGKITNLIEKSIYVNRPLMLDDLGISRDESQWGGITRKIRVRPIKAEENEEYKLDDDAYNPFKIKKPEVIEQLYSKFQTFESNITILDNQLCTAFKSPEDMANFFSLIRKQLEDNKLQQMYNFDRLALVNFIGEKFKLQGTQATRQHAVNLLDKFNTETGESLTVATCLYNPDFLKYCSMQFNLYKGYMAERTILFNGDTQGLPTQTTPEYLNFYILNNFDSRMKSYLYSDTFNKEFVEIVGKYKTVSSWQGIEGLNFDKLSSININIASDGTATNKTGILAVMLDRDAVASYYSRTEAESWRVPKKGTNYWESFTGSMINDLLENGVVFYIADA